MSNRSHPDWLRRASIWSPDQRPVTCGLQEIGDGSGIPWFELTCGAGEVATVLGALGEHCPGLTAPMLEDLLTPDDSPEGVTYGDGSIRLASTFSIEAKRDEAPVERGKPQGTGVLEFQPVEILAGDGWLISCWHPTRTFEGPARAADGPPKSADEIFSGVAERWHRSSGRCAGDLGVSVMHELALSYVPAQRELMNWLEDWELSLYVEDGIDSGDQLPELWGTMAMMRNWLSPLNRPGLRRDIGKAWLPAQDHAAVIEVDDRVDRALAGLAKLSENLRQAFGLLHVEQAEERRERDEKSKRRLENLAAVFLVPTLVVGFYGANTWVPGQGKHWGFWVMVGALVIFSCLTMAALRTQRRAGASAERVAEETNQLRRSTRARLSFAKQEDTTASPS